MLSCGVPSQRHVEIPLNGQKETFDILECSKDKTKISISKERKFLEDLIQDDNYSCQFPALASNEICFDIEYCANDKMAVKGSNCESECFNMTVTYDTSASSALFYLPYEGGQDVFMSSFENLNSSLLLENWNNTHFNETNKLKLQCSADSKTWELLDTNR